MYVRRGNVKYKYLFAVCLTLGALLCGSSVGRAQNGVTEWSKPIDITQPSSSEGGSYGVLVCDQYQNVHLWWANSKDDGAAIFYRNDIGNDWSAPLDVLAVPYATIAELYATISESDDVVHLIWQDAFIRGDVYYSQVSLPNAADPRAWLPPLLLLTGVDLARIQTDAAGLVHILYSTPSNEGMLNEAYYIKSTDGGQTWSDPILVIRMLSQLPCNIRPEMAIDRAGRVHVGITLRSLEYGLYSEVGYLSSSDGGQTWSEYRKIKETISNGAGVAGIRPYAFGEDEIHLTWHDPRRMHQWSFDGGKTWTDPIEIMPLGAAFGGPNQVVKDSAGMLHVVTAMTSGVFSAIWDGRSWKPPSRIEDRILDPHHQNMIVCQGNQLHVVYDDRLGENTVWYARRQVDAPHIEREPIPGPQPTPAPAIDVSTESTPTEIQTPASTDAPVARSTELEDADTMPSTVPLVLIPMVPVLVLLAAVFTVRHRKKQSS